MQDWAFLLKLQNIKIEGKKIRGRRNNKYITSACKNFGTSAYGELWRAEKKTEDNVDDFDHLPSTDFTRFHARWP